MAAMAYKAYQRPGEESATDWHWPEENIIVAGSSYNRISANSGQRTHNDVTAQRRKLSTYIVLHVQWRGGAARRFMPEMALCCSEQWAKKNSIKATAAYHYQHGFISETHA